MNVAILIGRLTRDPELRYLPGNGTAVTKFSVAVDKGLSREKKAEMQSQGKSTADFINVVVWGKQAENCANYLAKGRMAGIEGSIQTGSYENDKGQRIYTTDVVASKVQFLDDYRKDSGNQSEPAKDDDIPF